ncbi:SDR family oxidoreductase [Streptomyces durmitorensis]|uniref:SDR family oxidoreductase n=1 Tax=Streptomyces durmitorensis TaxID=319947 RepID=A0ABY4Q791_9ACTN|nr:SDR family oxidoreductase [Streptomyces durmitorensis]UQT61113.1 SDR family oxidoreductase [Streptomyces durmitorensis]
MTNMEIALAGGASFLGPRLASELLSRGHRLTLLATRDPAVVRRRLLGRLALLGYPPQSVLDMSDQLDAVYVDPQAPHLGMGRGAYEALADRFDVVWHCPASPDFHQGCDFAGGVPAKGAHALLPLAASGERPTVFHQVSTVFAHGAQPPGTVRESGAARTSGNCRNRHERAHADADRYVHSYAADTGARAVVHRTGLLVTDMADQPELPRHGLAQIAAVAGRLLSTAEGGERLSLSLGVPGDPEARLNLLPVVAAARTMAQVTERAHEPGPQLMHVVHPRDTPISRITAAFEHLFPLRLLLRPTGSAHLPVDVRGIPQGLDAVLPYLRQRLSFDTGALDSLGVRVRAPRVTTEYLVRGMKGAAMQSAVPEGGPHVGVLSASV